MALRSILALCTLLLTTVQAFNIVPVLIHDEGMLNGVVESELDPFAEVNPEMFEKLMRKVDAISRTIIFFIEENLTLQDITAKDYKGTIFPHSRKEFFDKKLKMFLQVQDPYLYIKKQYPSYGVNEFHLRSTMSKLRLEDSYRHILIFFEDNLNETRAVRLRRHDGIIQQVYFAIKQLTKGPVISIYTGKHGPEEWKKQLRLQLSDDSANNMRPTRKIGIVFDCDNATFELYGAKLFMESPLPPPLEPDTCTLLFLKQNQWAYDLHFKNNESKEAFTSRIQFAFTYIDPNNREVGWKLVEASYAIGEGKKLQSIVLNVEGNWTSWFTSKTPLVIYSSPGSGQPRLIIDKYVILLNKNKPLTSTTVGTASTLTATLTIIEHGSYELPRKWGQEGQSHSPAWSLPGSTGSPGDPDEAEYTNRGEGFGVRPNRLRQGPAGNIEPPEGGNNTSNTESNTPETGPKQEEGEDVMITPAILMGLIVCFIMIYVLFFGLGMIMNINTNSRFDSPDSKPLFDPETVKD